MRNQVKVRSKSAETRERILQAALDLFHSKGFELTTMRDIADRAGLATGAAYYYFDSKDAIVLAFYDRARREMEPLLEKGLDGSQDLRERLRRIIQVKLDYFAHSRELMAALSGHTNPQNPLSPFSEETKEIRDHDIGFFQRALEGSGTRVPKDLMPYLPRLLWMYQMGIILFWINDGSAGRKKTQFLLEKSLQIVTRLIAFAGLPLTRPLRKNVTELLETLMA